MNIITIAPHVHSIQSWIENLERRLANIDLDMTQLHKCELKFEADVAALTDQLQTVVSANKETLLKDVQDLRDIVLKIIHDISGPLS